MGGAASNNAMIGRQAGAFGPGWLARVCRPLIATMAGLIIMGSRASAETSVPEGVWLVDGKVAVQIFACEARMCGRIVWLSTPRNPLGQLDRDKHNPDLEQRQRQLCGQTIIWALEPAGPGRWKNGWFYNPDDGVTYRVSAQQKSADVITARAYLLTSLFGQTKTLTRVPLGVTDGWC